MPSLIKEDDLERALLDKLASEYGYETLNAYTLDPKDLNDGTHRTDKADVVLGDRLLRAALRLNPHLPPETVEGAVEQVSDKRKAMSLLAANRDLYGLVRDGVPVEYQDEQGRKQEDRVRLVDFRPPADGQPPANEFLAVQQLWVKGEGGYLRPDVVVYVNGIPLVFVELKNSNIKLKSAYDVNLTKYKTRIPQLFVPNALCVLSNGHGTKVGSLTAGWEHFFKWLRPDDEAETVDTDQIREAGTSLERVADGLLRPDRLLDYVENFVLYYGESQKIVAQNHQFVGVNKAYDAFLRRDETGGKLGVFWHTQGSGKSFSMIFLVRKVFRKAPGDFSFVVVTDRDDLDGQIYGNFLKTGTVTKQEAAQPTNGDQLRDFLRKDKRIVFTLIQKFRWDKGKEYPVLSDRDDVVVIVDEAHRTQYKALAENMRAGLPNAQYLAFTGTPLLGRDRKTNQWFGDYVSEYNFRQAIDDDATVPLFYEKRVPEVLQQNDDLSDEFYGILEDEDLDDAHREKLENRFSKEVEVIKRDDRLETVARDIVEHFPRRGYLGKGLVVTVDKYAAVTMYDKVSRLWKEAIKDLRGQIKRADSEVTTARLRRQLDWMRGVEMAVVVSHENGEDERFAGRGLDVKPHRKRMEAVDAHGHDVEFNFKDPDHPLQLVFVCAMWLTGFDAPTLSTLYLDKPMRGHTLMQTIARANRVTSHEVVGTAGAPVRKTNGEVVDYYNVFRNLQLALRDYAEGDNGQAPVREKKDLFALLDQAVAEGLDFCDEHGADLRSVVDSDDVFGNVARFEDYANALLADDDRRRAFNVYENTVSALYEASKPEVLGRPVVRTVAAFQYLRGVVDAIVDDADLDAVGHRVAQLLDESLVSTAPPPTADDEGYRITKSGQTLDLRNLDAARLRDEYKQTEHKNIEIADLRAFIERKLAQMLQRNTTRLDFALRLQGIIDRYNAGTSSNDNYFEELLRFAEELRAEDERHVRENLTEDELELFDLLRKEALTEAEIQAVKLAARSLLQRLRDGQPAVLVQDWHKDTQTKERVLSTMGEVLDSHLPQSYGRDEFADVRDRVFTLMLDRASQNYRWAA